MNKVAYEGIANRKSYILLAVVTLLLSTFLVNYRVISSYGQQSTINSTADQINPSLESQDKGKLLATPEPAANDLNTVEGEQSGTINDGSKEKATETQAKQNNADEATRNSVKDDNGDSNEVSGTPQSNEPEEDDNQNRDDDQNRDDRQDSESENDDENDDESEENDTPLDFEATTGLPFP